jgi:O-antigen ligase
MKSISIKNETIIFIFILILPLTLLFGTLVSEITIFLIGAFFLIKCYKKKEWHWIKSIELKLLILIWFYLILNSILANSTSLALSRGLFFFRFILLTFAISETFKNKEFQKLIFMFWSIIIIIIAVDIYFEFFFGKNMLGNISNYPDRIASFTGKELKIGHYMLATFLLPFAYFIHKNENTKIKFILFFILALVFSSIIVTGERSNSIRAIFCLFLFIFLLKKNNFFFIYKYIILFLTIILLYISVYNVNKIKSRYEEIINNIHKPITLLKESLHGSHYSTAWKIFKNYPYFGVGNKNFRIECQNQIYFDQDYKYTKFRCSTHPHQIYLEFLSELGILGTLIIIMFVTFAIIKSIYLYFKNYNLILLASSLYVVSIFIPFLPSGSFFTSFGATLFWLNIGVMFSATNKG